MGPPLSLTTDDSPSRFCARIRAEGFAVLQDEKASQLLDAVYSSWREFFQSASKSDFRAAAGRLDGFFPLESEHAVGQQLCDPKEFFHFYLDGVKPQATQALTIQLFSRLQATAETCLRWLDASLPMHVREELAMPLHAMIRHPDRLVLRVSNYPFEAAKTRQLAAAHHDINLLSLLPTPTHDGFEVRTPYGNWVRPAQQTDTICVFPGEMLEICTHGYYPSTFHRVVKPSDIRGGVSRLSLTFFVNPYDDVTLTPGRTARQVLNDRLAEIGYSV